MADKGNRKFSPRYRRQKEADEAESWRSTLGQDGVNHERSYSPKTKRGHSRTFESDGNRRAKATLSCSSPEGRAFGQSPSHKVRIQKGSPVDRRYWRERQRDGQKHDRLGKMHYNLSCNETVRLNISLISVYILSVYQTARRAGGRRAELSWLIAASLDRTFYTCAWKQKAKIVTLKRFV